MSKPVNVDEALTAGNAFGRGRTVFCSWSGGKDSAFALHRALMGGAIRGPLITMLTEDGQRSRSHGLRREILEAQAATMGTSIIFRATTWKGYEEAFIDAAREAVSSGAQDGVFGDLDFDENRAWEERMCQAAGAGCQLPLWHWPRDGYLSAVLGAGFVPLVVAVRDGSLPPEWLGQQLERSLVDGLRSRDVDLAGEAGEYHTVVVDGPLFRWRVHVLPGERVLRDGMWFIDLEPVIGAQQV